VTRLPHLDDEQAQLHLEGLLPGEEEARVRAHLGDCPACQALVASYQALGEALDGLPSAEPPADFTAGVLARIDERERVAARERRLVGLVLGAVGLVAAAAAALAGQSAWAPALSVASARIAQAAQALRISGQVLSPLVEALRFHILVACAALGLPLLLGLSRLVPARTRRIA
jgi:anti-sigma factor RsiW